MKKLVWCATIAIVGCGSSAPSPNTPPPAEAFTSPEPSAAPANDSASPEASAAPSAAPSSDAPAAAQESEAMTLAKDLMKSGGRRIGWSATKKGFVIPQSRRSGDTASLDIVFTDDMGQKRDVIRICQPGECEEHLTAKAAEALPKLSARLDSEGYTTVRAIGWPDDRNELDVSSMHMKLRLVGGKLEGVHEGKPAVHLGGSVKPPRLLAIYPVLDAKRLGIFSAEQGDDQNQVFSVLTLP